MKSFKTAIGVAFFALMLSTSIGQIVAAQTPEPITSETPQATEVQEASTDPVLGDEGDSDQEHFSETPTAESNDPEPSGQEIESSEETARQSSPSTPETSTDDEALTTQQTGTTADAISGPTLTSIDVSCDGSVRLVVHVDTIVEGTEIEVGPIGYPGAIPLSDEPAIVTLEENQSDYNMSFNSSSWTDHEYVLIAAVDFNADPPLLDSTTVDCSTAVVNPELTLSRMDASCDGAVTLSFDPGSIVGGERILIQVVAHPIEQVIETQELTIDAGKHDYSLIFNRTSPTDHYDSISIVVSDINKSDGELGTSHITCSDVLPALLTIISFSCDGTIIYEVGEGTNRGSDEVLFRISRSEEAAFDLVSKTITCLGPGRFTEQLDLRPADYPSLFATVSLGAAIDSDSISDCIGGGNPDVQPLTKIEIDTFDCTGSLGYTIIDGHYSGTLLGFELAGGDSSAPDWTATSGDENPWTWFYSDKSQPYPGAGSYSAQLDVRDSSYESLMVIIGDTGRAGEGIVTASKTITGCSDPVSKEGMFDLFFTLCADEDCNTADDSADGATVAWTVTPSEADASNQAMMGFAALQTIASTYTAVLEHGVASTETDPFPLWDYTICVEPTLTDGPNGDVTIGDAPLCDDVELTEENATTPLATGFSAEIQDSPDATEALIRQIIDILIRILSQLGVN